MTNYQKTLLAGVAALAIAAGTSFASAQSPHGAAAGGGMAGGGMSSGNSGSGEQSPATQAAPSTPSKGSGMSQHPGTGMQHGGTGSGSTGAGMRPQAEEHPGATEQKGPEKGQGGAKRSAQGTGGGKPSTAESGTPAGTREAQTPDHGAKGQKSGTAMEGHGAAPASGGTHEGANVQPSGGVKFSERQRTTIKRTIIDAHSAPRADHVDFNVRVGTVVPRDSIHVISVPETLVRIEPQWRGFLYFVYEDEVVIVNPNDMHIVAVVAV
jgi:hypothetical protein